MLLAWGCIAALGSGCFGPPKDPYVIQLEQQVTQLGEDNTRLGRELVECRASNEALGRQLAECRDLPPDLIPKLFTVRSLKIGSLTGGADYDGRPGDDGVTVYLTPLDRDGDPIKAAGEIEIFLYDLTAPARPREVGHYVTNEPGELSRMWYSGWMTNHYTIKCEWPPNAPPPATREVQVRATFLDWLTGEKFVATKQVKLNWLDHDATHPPDGGR